MSTYNFTNPAFGSSMPFAPVDGHYASVNVGHAFTPVDGHYNSVNVGHAFTCNDGMYHNNVDFETPGYHQNAYPVSMNNDASVEYGNLMDCTPTGNFTEAPYQFQPPAPQMSMQEMISTLMAAMTPKRRAIAERIQKKYPEIGAEDFLDCLLIPSKTDNKERNAYIVHLRNWDVGHEDIVVLGDLIISGSTVRGIWRNATTPAEDRPRSVKELWTPLQDFTLRLAVLEIQARYGLTPGTVAGLKGIPWAKVAELMVRSLGGDAFPFSALSVARRCRELEGVKKGEDDEEENDDDDNE
ncbi:hypothetical protein FAUST_4806 [Fusarium austroamericanum]|uniref:Uncharacterized protein n=1 Tax=Fusarium austroamericanum TaxID=282268 RepID=A0AAN6C2D7_FUSAU|nr:hypothetical protein FAUST_4806 [Fusarium austroamericanum]